MVTEKNFWRDNGQKFSKFDKKYKPTDLRSSTNNKTGNIKNTKVGLSLLNCLKPVIKRKILKVAKETHYIQRNKDKVHSEFCITNNAS